MTWLDSTSVTTAPNGLIANRLWPLTWLGIIQAVVHGIMPKYVCRRCGGIFKSQKDLDYHKRFTGH
jgi:hypothetical protein